MAKTDTEVTDPVMNTMAWGPSVDRTLTGGGSYNGRIVHPTGRRCYSRFQDREEFRWTGKATYQMGTRHPDTAIQESFPDIRLITSSCGDNTAY